MDKHSRVFVAGHGGMVGSAVMRNLKAQGFTQLITADKASLDLVSQQAVNDFLGAEKPDCIVVAAARVGGIYANDTYPADFIYQNLMIEANLVHGAHQIDCERLLFLGSSCIYPRLAIQPMTEDALLQGTLESTNEPYAIAKIAGIKLCESYHRQHGRDYRSLMPTNLYGIGDNFHEQDSHVIPALMRRMHAAACNHDAQVTIWGTGQARREFLNVDDLASACSHFLSMPTEDYWHGVDERLSHVNIGTGVDMTVEELALTIRDVVGYRGELVFDAEKPDGAPRKLLDVSLANRLGWQSSIGLREGLQATYRWFIDNQDSLRS